MAAVFHPSAKRLAAWLDTGESSDVDRHVQTCPRCADRLERLAGVLPNLRDALLSALAVPEDLEATLLAGVAERTRRRGELELLAGMFSLPVETLRAMSPDTEPS